MYQYVARQPDSAGYCFPMVRRGHEYCGCMLSKTIYWYRKHDPATGPWPNHFAVTDHYVERLLAEQRDFVPSSHQFASYGFIRTGLAATVLSRAEQRPREVAELFALLADELG